MADAADTASGPVLEIAGARHHPPQPAEAS